MKTLRRERPHPRRRLERVRCAFIIKLEAKRKIKAASEFFIERERERGGEWKVQGRESEK